ncbi:MAG: hypothetical protein ACR2LV_10475 [Solirubrobacteraceae bacterium]
MSTTTITPTAHTKATVGERVELARYTAAAGGERILYGQRVEGVVRLTDNPACGRGRAHLIERGLEHDGHDALIALVADYLDQAERLKETPMGASLLDRYLQHIDDTDKE